MSIYLKGGAGGVERGEGGNFFFFFFFFVGFVVFFCGWVGREEVRYRDNGSDKLKGE